MYNFIPTRLLNRKKCTEIMIHGLDEVPEDVRISVDEIEDNGYDNNHTGAPKIGVGLIVEGFE